MKKRANLITRVALAATIFVTALAGVTPMTAKAADPETKIVITNGTPNDTSDDDTYIITYSVGSFTGATFTPASNETINEEKATADFIVNLPDTATLDGYEFEGWICPQGNPITSVRKSNYVDPARTYPVTLSMKEATPATPTITVTNLDTNAALSDNAEVDENTNIRVNVTFGNNTKTKAVTSTANNEPTTRPETFDFAIKADTRIAATATNINETSTAAFTIKVKAPAPAPTPVTYRVNYDYNGGERQSSYSSNSDINVNLASYSLRANPTRDGYTFGGWALASAPTVPVTSLTAPASGTEIDLVAIWTANQTAEKTFTALNASETEIDLADSNTGNITFTATMSDSNSVTARNITRGGNVVGTLRAPHNKTFLISKETFANFGVGLYSVNVTDDNGETRSVGINVVDSRSSSNTTYDGTIALDPASVSKGSETNVYIKATPKTSGGVNTITGVVDANGRTPAGIYGLGTSEVRLAGSYVKGLTENTKLTVTMSDGSTKEVTLNLGAASGEAKKLSSIQWASNGNDANLGTSFTDEGGRHPAATGDNPSVPTIIYLVGGTKEFPNGTTKEKIEAELKTSDSINVTLEGLSAHNRTVTWDYSYTHAIDNNKRYSAYNNDKTDAQYFTLYSKPIAFSNANSDGTFPYSVDGHNYFRLKIEVKVLEAGANTNTTSGSNPPTNLTFTPGEGTYVTPGSLITFSATASSGTVSYRATSGNTTPTTTNGADGARGVTIPSGAPAGDYKMNVIAFTSSSNTTTKSATFKVVTNNKYNVTYNNGVLTCDGNLSDFKGLWIQGASSGYEFVPATNYTTASGSTIVTLSPTYLNSQTGSKNVRMVYTDGYAEGNFTLTAGATNAVTPLTDLTTTQTSNSGPSDGSRAGVGTDDRSELVIMFVLLGMLIAGFVVSVYYKNEKLRRNRYMD